MFFPPIIMSLSGIIHGLVPNRKVARPRLVISYTTYKMKVNCSRGWEFIWSLGSGWRRGLWTFEINIFHSIFITRAATSEKGKTTSISFFNSDVARFFLGVKQCQSKKPKKHLLSLKKEVIQPHLPVRLPCLTKGINDGSLKENSWPLLFC